jgi:hypothetical protein
MNIKMSSPERATGVVKSNSRANVALSGLEFGWQVEATKPWGSRPRLYSGAPFGAQITPCGCGYEGNAAAPDNWLIRAAERQVASGGSADSHSYHAARLVVSRRVTQSQGRAAKDGSTRM